MHSRPTLRRLAPAALAAVLALTLVPATSVANHACSHPEGMLPVDGKVKTISNGQTHWYSHPATGLVEYDLVAHNTNGYSIVLNVYDGCGNSVCSDYAWTSGGTGLGKPTARCTHVATGPYYVSVSFPGFSTATYALAAAGAPYDI